MSLSYRTPQQAIVVQKKSLSTDQLVTRLVLFNEDGTPFTGSSAPSDPVLPDVDFLGDVTDVLDGE